jgi:hypothetical protein
MGVGEAGPTKVTSIRALRQTRYIDAKLVTDLVSSASNADPAVAKVTARGIRFRAND